MQLWQLRRLYLSSICQSTCLRDVSAQGSLELLAFKATPDHAHSVLRALDCWVPTSSDPCPP